MAIAHAVMMHLINGEHLMTMSVGRMILSNCVFKNRPVIVASASPTFVRGGSHSLVSDRGMTIWLLCSAKTSSALSPCRTNAEKLYFSVVLSETFPISCVILTEFVYLILINCFYNDNYYINPVKIM